MGQRWSKYLLYCFLASFVLAGCAGEQTKPGATAVKPPTAEAPAKENVYKGKIAGKSNKAKTISIVVGKGDAAQSIMLKFNDQTTGLEYAKKGEAAIITYVVQGKDKVATVVKPKLAKLPEGVVEIKTEELKQLQDQGADFVLIDARPASRYHQAHLPGAISIPVAKLKKEKDGVLPKDKEQMLVFYCGGPT